MGESRKMRAGESSEYSLIERVPDPNQKATCVEHFRFMI